jgi:hypothetical protein
VGIIDTLSVGFRLVTTKPALMLIPIVLDLFLWLGPRLSMQPLIAKAAATLEAWSADLGQTAASPANVETIRANIELLQSSGLGEMNLFRVLAWGSSLGLPSLAGTDMAQPASSAVLKIYEFWPLVPIELLLLAGGLLITAAFLSMIGWQIRGEPMALGRLAGWTLTTWLRLLVIMIPIGALMLVTLLAAAIFSPLGIVLLIGLIWLLLYIYFFPQAIALAGHQPLGAVLSSAQIVRLNLWPTVRLLLLIFVLSNGLGLIWERLAAHSTLGTVMAIATSAYVGTALTAAVFVFYRDRLILLHEMITRQRSAEGS